MNYESIIYKLEETFKSYLASTLMASLWKTTRVSRIIQSIPNSWLWTNKLISASSISATSSIVVLLTVLSFFVIIFLSLFFQNLPKWDNKWQLIFSTSWCCYHWCKICDSGKCGELFHQGCHDFGFSRISLVDNLVNDPKICSVLKLTYTIIQYWIGLTSTLICAR